MNTYVNGELGREKHIFRQELLFFSKKVENVLQISNNVVPLHPLKEHNSRILSVSSTVSGLNETKKRNTQLVEHNLFKEL